MGPIDKDTRKKEQVYIPYKRKHPHLSGVQLHLPASFDTVYRALYDCAWRVIETKGSVGGDEMFRSAGRHIVLEKETPKDCALYYSLELSGEGNYWVARNSPMSDCIGELEKDLKEINEKNGKIKNENNFHSK